MARPDPRTVAEVMSTALVTVTVSESVDRAARLMEERQIRQLPVVDDAGTLQGLLSYRALLRVIAAPSPPGSGATLTVGSLMDRTPRTLPSATTLPDALQTLLDEDLTAVPVVDGDRLVGLISEHDLVAVAARLLDSGGRNG